MDKWHTNGDRILSWSEAIRKVMDVLTFKIVGNRHCLFQRGLIVGPSLTLLRKLNLPVQSYK
ncbi:MAG: hypothetical protein QG657_4685 [Acidobacteriota bacterium]|nr:hypothetical protein [Acidobacteriota bacterium]